MWAVYALLSSLFSCAYYFGNQISKVAPNIFMFYRGAVPAILLLPLLPIVDFIPNWQFYIICILQGAIVSFIDYRNFRAMRTWGAETISSIHPFNIGFVFVCWVIIKPSDIVFYLEHPFRGCFIGFDRRYLCSFIFSAIKTQRSSFALYDSLYFSQRFM